MERPKHTSIEQSGATELRSSRIAQTAPPCVKESMRHNVTPLHTDGTRSARAPAVSWPTLNGLRTRLATLRLPHLLRPPRVLRTVRRLAMDVTVARLGKAFGPRATRLVADAVRVQECPPMTTDVDSTASLHLSNSSTPPRRPPSVATTSHSYQHGGMVVYVDSSGFKPPFYHIVALALVSHLMIIVSLIPSHTFITTQVHKPVWV